VLKREFHRRPVLMVVACTPRPELAIEIPKEA
jgi:hypothetical protein